VETRAQLRVDQELEPAAILGATTTLIMAPGRLLVAAGGIWGRPWRQMVAPPASGSAARYRLWPSLVAWIEAISKFSLQISKVLALSLSQGQFL
jgi:hypothetical protein